MQANEIFGRECFLKKTIDYLGCYEGKALLSGNYCVDLGLRPPWSHSNSLIAGPYPIQNPTIPHSVFIMVTF
jgi:hypothetical protein